MINGKLHNKENQFSVVDSAFTRIVGGQSGKVGQFPFSVSLRVMRTSS